MSLSSSSSVVPASSRRWIARPSIVIADEAVSVSTIRTRPPPTSSAATRALLVGREEVLRRRLRGGRELRRRAQARVELLRSELDVVAVALVAEAHVQRDDAPVREALRRLGEVGRRVEDDRGIRRR